MEHSTSQGSDQQKTSFSPQKFGKPPTKSELLELIKGAFEKGEIDLCKIYTQVSPLELLEFIFKTDDDFLHEAAKKSGFECCELLDKLDFELNSICQFDPKTSKRFVKHLNQSQKPPEIQTKLLSILFDFNEEEVMNAVQTHGNEKTKKILREAKMLAQIKREYSEGSRKGSYSSEGSSLDGEA